MDNLEQYDEDLIKEFQIMCNDTIEFIEEIWSDISLSNLNGIMKDMADLFSKLSEIISYLDKVMKSTNSFLNINNIFEKLELLQNAMSIPDYILIGDLVKYEIKPIVNEWSCIFENRTEGYIN